MLRHGYRYIIDGYLSRSYVFAADEVYYKNTYTPNGPGKSLYAVFEDLSMACTSTHSYDWFYFLRLPMANYHVYMIY